MPPAGPNASAPHDADEAEHRRRLSRLLLWQCGLLLCTLTSLGLVLPWKLLAAAFALAAVVVGVVAWRRTGRLSSPGPLRVMLGAGVLMGAFVAVFALTPLLFWEASQAFDVCLRESLTLRATASCEAEFTRSMTGLGRLGG